MTGSAAEAVAHFPFDDSSAGEARRFVASTLKGWGLDRLEDVACLLVSELVSNVVLHAATDLDLHVLRCDERVRVEVHDRDARLPERKYYSPTATTGRGLVFLAELAQDWGADARPGGKSVWFELDETQPDAEPHAIGLEFDLDDWEDWDDLPDAGGSDAAAKGTVPSSQEAATSAVSLVGAP